MNRFRTRWIWLSFGLAVFSITSPVSGNEGVLEINAACVAQGCWPGDDPGYPVSISSGGSYALTSNLNSNTNQDTFIQIGASHVTLDLRGFVIGYCITGGFCAPLGEGSAIKAGESTSNVTIRNGSVVKAGTSGIEINQYSKVVDVTVIRSTGVGILASGEGNIIEGCIVEDAGSYGVSMNSAGANTLRHSLITNSASWGLLGSAGLLFYGNAFSDNNGGAEQIGGSAALASGGGFDNRCGTSFDCP